MIVSYLTLTNVCKQYRTGDVCVDALKDASFSLEDGEFAPMFETCESKLSGKKIALFGSYGWGDGQWMRDWVERAQGDGAQVLNGEGLICNEAPDEDVQAACRKLGADLAAW